MKPAPDDPRLTAYVLGECPPDEAAEIARAIAADPALGLAVCEIEAVERLLSTTLADGDDALTARQRANVLAAARAADAAPVTRIEPRARHRVTRWLAPLSAAALILAGIILFTPDDPAGAGAGSTADSGDHPVPVSMLPAPGPADASGARRDGAAPATMPAPPPPSPAGHPVLRPRGPVSAAHHPQLRLPIQSGRASYGWIAESIRERGELPPADAVRAEEILNHHRIRPVGATAVHRGITLTAETVPCPWKPSATLAVIAIRGARESAHEVTTTWDADAPAVWRYRLIGHATPAGVAERPLERTLPAAAEHVVILEIEPSSPGQESFGSVEWTVDGEPAPTLAISRDPDRSPSGDVRFAALACAFAEWLRDPASDENGIDPGMLRIMTREVESDTPVPERAEFLELLKKALEIAENG